MNETDDRPMKLYPARTRQVGLLSLIAVYANIVVCGFAYGTYNHEFELPFVNWLLDRSLYPNDSITEAFTRFPTVFWPVVARLSHSLSTERVIFLFFLLTKLVFFAAIARLVAARVKDDIIATCIVLAVALSPLLNDLTPLGASNILDPIQTHTSLTVALLVWVGCFLLEGRWVPAAVLCALTIYLDALFFIYSLFAFAVFAVHDWRIRRQAILLAGFLGAVISSLWLLIARSSIRQSYPKTYVEALLAFYPFHLTLRSHEIYELVAPAALMLAARLMVAIARKTGQVRDHRLEILTASFLIPVFLGALFGEFFLTPTIARLQLLRADSFLLLYSILMIQIYGGNLLWVSEQISAGTFFLAALAILLPLGDSWGLVWPLLLFEVLFLRSGRGMEMICRGMARAGRFRWPVLFFLVSGMALSGWADAEWTSTAVILLVIIGGYLYVSEKPPGMLRLRNRSLAAVVSAISLAMMALGNIPTVSSLWNPVVVPSPVARDWRAVQEWAKINTPRDAQFLVPTYPGGFRTFSERSSWGEWKDGQAMYLYPPFEDEYRKRMMAVGYSWGKWNGTEAIAETYKHLSWERLLAIAQQNHLSYIIQFHDVAYRSTPIFANQHYSVYKVAY
jgi:hypothetical protein